VLASFLAFAGVSAAVIMTPGPDTAVTIGSTLSGGRTGEPAAGCAAGPRRSPASCWRRGLLSDLGNPKMAVFFTSLLPQFGSSFAILSLLGLMFAAMTFTWLAGYAVAVARLGGLLRRARFRRALDAVTGAALIAFGLNLAIEQR